VCPRSICNASVKNIVRFYGLAAGRFGILVLSSFDVGYVMQWQLTAPPVSDVIPPTTPADKLLLGVVSGVTSDDTKAVDTGCLSPTDRDLLEMTPGAPV
jgi:hypothetical protein